MSTSNTSSVTGRKGLDTFPEFLVYTSGLQQTVHIDMCVTVPWYVCRGERASQELALCFHFVEAESLLLFLTLGCILSG